MSKISQIKTEDVVVLLDGDIGKGNIHDAIMNNFRVNKREAKLLYDRARMMRKRNSGKVDDFEDQSKSEMTNEDNKITLTSKNKDRTTIDKLIKDFGINKKDVIVTASRINEWGTAERPNRQIRVDLKPKIPELCNYPSIKAVRPKYTKTIKNIPKSKQKLKRALIVPDAQVGYNRYDVHGTALTPYHDFSAMQLVVDIARDIKPDVIVMLGDMLDLPSFGKYEQKPEFYFTTQPSLVTLRYFIDDLRASTNKLVYIYGNHEARFRKSLIDAQVEATQLKKVDFKEDAPYTYSLEYLLDLDNIGVEYYSDYPHDEFNINDHLVCSHGNTARNRSGATVAGIIEGDPHVSRIVGHIHRCEQATRTTYKSGQPITNSAFSPGTLCRLDRHIPQAGTRPNWQQGFGLVWYEENDGMFDVDLHHIEKGSAIVDGKMYRANMDLNKISKRIGYNIV